MKANDSVEKEKIAAFIGASQVKRRVGKPTQGSTVVFYSLFLFIVYPTK